MKTLIEVEPTDTVQKVIDEFVRKEGVSLHDSRARLLFKGQELSTSRTISQCNINSGDTLEFRKQVVSEPARGSTCSWF